MTQWGTGGLLYGLDVDGTGNVFVANTNGHRVEVYSSSGTLLAQWGVGGGGNGEFHFPFSVAVDPAGLVYVADTNNNRIQKFAPGATVTTGVSWGGVKARYR